MREGDEGAVKILDRLDRINQNIRMLSTPSVSADTVRDPVEKPQATPDTVNRRDFLRTAVTAGVAGVCAGCGYSQEQLDTLDNNAELIVALRGSGLSVEPAFDGRLTRPSTIKIKSSGVICARFAKQADATYLVYYPNGTEIGKKAPSDPLSMVEPSIATAKVFQSVDEAAKFLRETFDKPKAVAEKE